MKEARECLYWIELLHRNNYIDDKAYQSINEDADYFKGCGPAVGLCNKYNVNFINFIDCEKVSNNIEYFQDNGHLNNNGAIAYTNLIVNAVLRGFKF